MESAVSPVFFISAYGASSASAEAPSALGSAIARLPPSSTEDQEAGALAAGPPMRPTGVWARTAATGVPVQPALVSWPFQVGLSGIQISGSAALGSLSWATTSFTVPAVTWMSMQGSSWLTSFTACLTRSSMTGAVVSVTTSEMQSAPSGSPLAPRTAKKPMRPTTSASARPPRTKVLAGRPPAPVPSEPSGVPDAVSGAVESSRLMGGPPREVSIGGLGETNVQPLPLVAERRNESATNEHCPGGRPGRPQRRRQVPARGAPRAPRAAPRRLLQGRRRPLAPPHHGRGECGARRLGPPGLLARGRRPRRAARAVRYGTQRGAPLRDRPQRTLRLAHGRPRWQQPLRRGGDLRAGGRGRVPRRGHPGRGLLHHPAPARHVLAAPHPRPAGAPQAAARARTPWTGPDARPAARRRSRRPPGVPAGDGRPGLRRADLRQRRGYASMRAA